MFAPTIAGPSSEKPQTRSGTQTIQPRSACARTFALSAGHRHQLPPPGLGNQATLRRLGRKPSLNLQAKLAVGPTTDPLEHEADRIADQVTRVSAPASPIFSGIHRKCAACEAESQATEKDEEHPVRRRAVRGVGAQGGTAPPSVHSVLAGAGRPLDAATRGYFEPRFGASFADVRVHDHPAAHASARDIGALAYASGRDIVFSQGAYNPHDSAGRRLLAHELTHVVQAGAAERTTVHRVAPASIQGEIGELLATQFLDEQGLYVFVDWSKNVNENGFDFIAFDPKTGRTWYIDNKAYSGTIDEVTSFSTARMGPNEATAKAYLQKVGTAESRAALAAVEKGAVEKVVINAFSKGNAGFSEKVFAAGIKAFDVRLGKLFATRATWIAELRAADLLTGVRKFSRRDRVLGRQRGFATVGGMVWTLVVIGTTLYAISQAEDKPKALLEVAADFAIAGIIFKLGGGVATIAFMALSLCSDDRRMQEECDRKEIVMGFLRKRLPNAIKTTTSLYIFTTEEVDPVIYQEAYDLLFNTEPIRLEPTPKIPAWSPAPAAGVTPPSGPAPLAPPPPR